MEWSDVLADPSLRDLPYRIETNEHGQIVMSPASNEHGDAQVAIVRALETHLAGGRASIENSIATPQGTKVADVTWRSDAFQSAHAGETPFTRAPEVCVEVISSSNTAAEIDEKRRLYFEAVAEEVWVCRADGSMLFYCAPDGPAVERSARAPAFPERVTL